MSVLKLENISKFVRGYAGSGQLILDDLNFEINIKEQANYVTAVLAPSGAGKTTLLKIISGVEEQTSGKIFLQGEEYKNAGGLVPFIPEKASSFPWMNVAQNIKFALELKYKAADAQKLNELISFVGLTGYEDHFPDERSLGFRLRISLARALAVAPKLISIDDPLRNLHGETKKEIKQLIKKIPEEKNIPLLIATTNISEAIEMSDEIILMKKHPGKILGIIDLNRELISGKNQKYIEEVKQQITKSFAEQENSQLVSDAGIK